MEIAQFTFNMFGVNTYILWDPATLEAAVVDPGMVNQAERDRFDEFVANNGLNIRYLIATHLHIDHSFGINYVAQKYGIQLAANESDGFLGDNLASQAMMFGLDTSVANIKIGKNLREGDVLYLGKEPLWVLQVPGHSPGSIVIYAPESGIVIVGDVLFDSSIGRTDLPGGNYGQLIDGIKSKLLTLPGDTVVYPGHGPATTIADEAARNPFLR